MRFVVLGQQTPSARKSFFHVNLLWVPNDPIFSARDSETRFFLEVVFAQRFFSSQVPKKCTDLDPSLLYNLILETHSKFARKNNFLSRCARRLHRRAALLRTLRWLSKFCGMIRRGCRKKQVPTGVLKRRVFRQCQFPIWHNDVFSLRSRSDVHVTNFGATRPDSIVFVLYHSFAL